MSVTKRIGVLALQGAVHAHAAHLEALGYELVPVKTKEQIEDETLLGLIIPGGESSTMLKLINTFNLIGPIREFLQTRPVWGICAGSILLASKVTHPDQESFKAIDMTAVRNAYGSQLESFVAKLESIEDAAFIRAPQFEDIGAGVSVIETHEGKAVWIRQGHHMATSFHPELSKTVPSKCHEYFVREMLVPSAQN